MEDFRKKSNFDRAALYYSAPKEIEEEPIVKSAIPQVETYNSSNRKYVCNNCKKRFFTKNSLNNHIITHSPNDPIDTNTDHDNNSDWKNRYAQNKGVLCKRGECNFNALDTVEYSKHIKTCVGTRYTTDETNAFCKLCDSYFSSDHHKKIHSVLFHSIDNQGITLADNDLEGDHLSEYLLIHSYKNDIQTENDVPLSKYHHSSKLDIDRSESDISTYSLSDSSHKVNKVAGGSVTNKIEDSDITPSNIQNSTIDSVSFVEVVNSVKPGVSLADIKRGTLENVENKANDRNISQIVDSSIISNVLSGCVDRDLLISKIGDTSELEADIRKTSAENNHTTSGDREIVVADSTVTVGDIPRTFEVADTSVTPKKHKEISVCVNLDENNPDRVRAVKSIVRETVFPETETCLEQQQRKDQITDFVESKHIVFDASVTSAAKTSKTSEIVNCRGTSVEINTDIINDTIKIVVNPAVREPITINLSLSSFTQSQRSVKNSQDLESEQSEIELSQTRSSVVVSNHLEELEKMSKIANSENSASEKNSNPAFEASDTRNHVELSKPSSEVNEASSVVLISNSSETSDKTISSESDKDKGNNVEDCSESISPESNNQNLCEMNETTSKNSSENTESKLAEKCSSETPNATKILNNVSGHDVTDGIPINADENTTPETPASSDKNTVPCDSQESDNRELSENESNSSLVLDSHNSTSELDSQKFDDNFCNAVNQKSLPEKRIRKIKKLADDFTLLMDSNPELRARIMPKDNQASISKKKKDAQKHDPKSSRSSPKNKSMEKTTAVQGTKKKESDRKSESKSPLIKPKSSAVETKVKVGKGENTSFIDSKQRKISPVVSKGKNISSDKPNEKRTSLADLKKKNTTPDKSSPEKQSEEDSAEKKKRTWTKKVVPVQENLMITQRSVRQRKKLVLPDFDYGVEGKQDTDDVDEEPKKFTYSVNNTSVPVHTRVERRGRPRKQTGIVKTPVENVIVSKSPKDNVPTKKEKQKKIETDGEEFCLDSTINEADSFIKNEDLTIEDQEEDDPQNELHSWLKQVDFSEQSPFDSWTPDEKSKAQKTMKKKLRKKRDMVAKLEFLKKMPQLLATDKPSSEMTKSVLNETLSAGGKKEKAIQNVSGPTNDRLLNEMTVPKKKLGRPRKSVEDVARNHTQPQKNVTTVTNEKDSQSAEVGTQTNVHMLKPPLEVKDIKRVPKKKLPFDPDSNTDQTKSFAKKKLMEEHVNLEPTHAKRIPKRKIPFDPDGEPELREKKIRKQKLMLEEQLEDPIKRSEITFAYMSIVKKGEEMKDTRRSGKGRPKNESIPSNKNVSSTSTDIVSNKDENDETIKVENSNEQLEIKKEEDIDIVPEMHDENPFDYDSTQQMTDSTANTTMELSNPNENETARPKEKAHSKSKKQKQRLSIMNSKNNSVENGNTSDEMKKIDEDLYRSDVRNKSRYKRNFKKQPGCLEPQESMNDIVTCGRCKKKMTRAHYLTNHEISHYYLSWIEGEPEINLNDDNEMIRIMQSYISSDALRKKAIRLACEQCDKVMKSVIGYVSHVRFCQKTDEQELFETCTLCGKMLKPSSIRHHYVKYHGISKFTFGTDGRMLPDMSSIDTSNQSKIVDSSLAPAMKNSRMGFERVPVQKADILRDEVFWTNLKTSYDLYMCMGLSCKHMTLSKDDLKTHILNCGASFCEFSCAACSFRTKYENEIIYHSKKKCKETSDVEDNEQQEKEEMPSTMASDRRLSTRIRKRKFVIDYDDMEDDGYRKGKKVKDRDSDQNYKFSEIDTEDTDESDSDEDFKYERLRSRYSRKSINKISEDVGLRQAFLSYCGNRHTDSLNWTVEVRLKTFSAGPVHEHLKVNMNEWETFPSSDSAKYTPMQRKSPSVTFDRQSFVQYDIFQSAVVKGVPLCYTGGPVWSMAWAPLPAHIVEQYLAVASLQHMNQKIEVGSPVEFPAMVQIWKFSSIDNISNDIHKPTLAWAISHSFGAVWSMEWCPTGGFDSSSKPVRLGILALGTSAGCVVIYSVPRLDCVGDNSGVVTNPEPDLLLKVRSDNVQCTRIVWQRNYLPNIIFGGFSDGSIALWNVSTVSPILKKDKVIYPFRTFEAHTAAITALDVHWVDGGRFFLTGSIDRPIKYWDLEDLSGPMYEHEKSALVLSAAWMHHWAVSAQGYDYFSQIEPSVFINHPRDLWEKRKPVLNINDCIWSVAYSDWNDAVAVSSNGGFVSVYGAKHVATLSYKSPDFDKIITQTDLVPMKGNERKIDGNGKPDDINDYVTITKDNAVFFDDRIKEKPDATRKDFEADRNNVLSINKVSWNNNYNNFNWLAVGYECGFVRVIRVERYDKHHLTKFYKMNENSSITLL